MNEIYVGRQNIYDRKSRVVAYELLYRPTSANAAQVVDGDQATAEVLFHTLTTIGLDQLVGDCPAFINVTRNMFMHPSLAALPPDRVVLEVLEDIKADHALLDVLESLVSAGYRLALDDFVLTPDTQRLLGFAQLVKLDVLTTPMAEVIPLVSQFRSQGMKLLAEKIETQAMYQQCLELGFDYFQGYYFSQPQLVSGRGVPANKAALLYLIGKLNDPAATLETIEQLIARDATLSYKLLRYLNSAFFRLSHPVDTIHRAVVFLGLDSLRAWATLMMLTSFSEARDDLTSTALMRAYMCRNLAEEQPQTVPDTAFITGLLSVMDALLKAPMKQVLDHLPLEEAIAQALLNHDGPYGRLLHCTLAHERGDWDVVDNCGIDPEAIQNAFLEALEQSQSAAVTI